VRRLLPLLLVVPLLSACGSGSSSDEPACCPPSSHPTAPSRTHPPRTFVPRQAEAGIAPWRLPVASGRQAVVTMGHDRVLLAGGLLDGDVSTAQALRIDLRSGHSTRLTDLPVPVHDTAGGVVGGLPTVVGGGNASEQSVIQTYDGEAWRVTGHLPTTRSDLSVVEHQGAAYVIGGYDGTGTPTEILQLHAHGSPTPVGSLVHGVRYAATAVFGHTAYVFGGEVLDRELDSVQAVDLTTGRTRVVARLPVPIGHAMAATIGSRILLMGGRVTPDRQTDAMWWFDPRTGHFTHAGHLPHPLSDAAVASFGHRIWLLGGEQPAVTDEVVSLAIR
jgi:hypothetical protein